MAVSEEIQKQVLEEATSATPNFEVDMNDPRFAEANAGAEQMWNDYNQTVGGIIGNTDSLYSDLNDALEEHKNTQSQLQQERTDFTIEQIEQQKDKTHSDYVKEQAGAYVDWQKQSNKYGVEAEKMASAGMTGTGYSESSQVSMYNTYQNRIATARESYNTAVLNYNNAIKDAQLQNNAALAEIAFSTLQQQLQLSIEAANYKNNLIIDLANKKVEMENLKWNRYQDVLQQINTEKSLAWDAAKYYDNKAWQTEQAEIDRNHQLERDKLNREFEEKMAKIEQDYKIAYLNAQTEKERQLAKEAHERDMAKLAQQQKNAMPQLDKQLANEKALYDYKNAISGTAITEGSSSGSSSGTKIGTTSTAKKSTTYTEGILELGYGPISREYADKLVQEGKVIRTYDAKTRTYHYRKATAKEMAANKVQLQGW